MHKWKLSLSVFPRLKLLGYLSQFFCGAILAILVDSWCYHCSCLPCISSGNFQSCSRNSLTKYESLVHTNKKKIKMQCLLALSSLPVNCNSGTISWVCGYLCHPGLNQSTHESNLETSSNPFRSIRHPATTGNAVVMLFIYKKSLSRTHTESLIGKANYYFEVWNIEGQSLFQTKCLDAKPWKEAEPYLLAKLCCFSAQKSVLLILFPLPPAAKHGTVSQEGSRQDPHSQTPAGACRWAQGSGTFHGEAKRDPTNCSVTATGDRQRHGRHLSQTHLHRLLLFGHQTPGNSRRSFRLTARETAGVMETGRETKRGAKGRATNIRAVVKCAVEIKSITTECFPVGREI